MDLRELGRANRREILKILLRTGGLSRTEISRRTGLAMSSLSEIIDQLLREGIVESRDIIKNGKRGRPSTVMALNPDQSLVVVAGYCPESAVAHLADPTGRILRTEAVALSSKPTLQQYLNAEKQAVEAVGQGNWTRIQGITVIGPGVVDSQQGTLLTSARHGWGVGQMVEPFRSFGKCVFLQNGSRLRALAENWYGAAQDVKDFLYFHLDRGIGGAVVLDDSLLAGPSHGAGEFGHVIVDSSDRTCACGARGCLEAAASMNAIVDALAVHSCKTFGEARSLLKQNNRRAVEVFEQAATAIAQVIVNAATSIGPTTVLLGGNMVDQTDDEFIQLVRQKVQDICCFVRSIEIRKCLLPDDRSDILGAVVYALQELDIEMRDSTDDP